jgi:hypothetical protein
VNGYEPSVLSPILLQMGALAARAEHSQYPPLAQSIVDDRNADIGYIHGFSLNTKPHP